MPRTRTILEDKEIEQHICQETAFLSIRETKSGRCEAHGRAGRQADRMERSLCVVQLVECQAPT